MRFLLVTFVVLAACAKVPPLQGPLCVSHIEYDESGVAFVSEVLCPQEQFSTSDERFLDYVLFHRETAIKEFQLRFQCESWKEGTELRHAGEMQKELEQILGPF